MAKGAHIINFVRTGTKHKKGNVIIQITQAESALWMATAITSLDSDPITSDPG